MSGGSLNYIYGRLNDELETVKSHFNNTYCPLHGETPDREKWEMAQQFIAKLRAVSAALHDIEWVISGDYGRGDEFESMQVVLE